LRQIWTKRWDCLSSKQNLAVKECSIVLMPI
jgi:hypothetical protein